MCEILAEKSRGVSHFKHDTPRSKAVFQDKMSELATICALEELRCQNLAGEKIQHIQTGPVIVSESGRVAAFGESD